MNEQELAVWGRIEEFAIDHPRATHPFSRRLAKENGWTAEYTARVVREYRRFAFLFVVAGHPVSPSDDVDRAWHLHMLYSENYWDGFCGRALGRSLHHRPSQGIPGDGAKFEDWYQKTLSSYLRLFGEPPPADIWPSPAAKQGRIKDFGRVDRRSNWVIPKPKKRSHPAGANVGRIRMITLLSICLLVIGCTDAVKGANPLDWTGPDFLEPYVAMFAVCYLLGWGLRYRLRVPQPGQVPPAGLEPYEVTYLVGGGRRTIEAAVANLVRQDALAVGPANGLVAHAASYGGKSDLERRVLAIVRQHQPIEFEVLEQMAGPHLAAVDASLTSKGLLMSLPAARLATVVPLAVGILPVAIGGVKIAIGLSRDRPVGYLVGLCLVSAIVVLASFARRPYRSRYGDGVYADLLTRYEFLRGASAADIAANAGPESDDFAIAVGLYGMDMLVGSPYSGLAMMVNPPVLMGGSNCNSAGNPTSGTGGASSCNSSNCNSGGDSGGGGSSGCGGCSGGGGGCSS